MTEILKHRGPDGGKEIFLQKEGFQMGIGHRRLSVIDLSDCGTQPMKFGELLITFNGEIYNYQPIKKELEGLGHKFDSRSDTEVILHAYAQWGESCLERFRGMFAFVILNTETLDVFSVRDRAGIKPLFFYFKNGLFLFGSELKAFHQHPGFKKELAPEAVEMFMRFGNIPAPYSIFKDTCKLKPGHYLRFNIRDLANGGEELLQHQYWNVYNVYNQPKIDISFEDARDETERILRESALLRLVSDVPAGVFLSSGFDSSSVACLLQADHTQKLKTFTISVPEIGLNEAPYARQIAQRLGTDHTEVECSVQEALGLIDDLPYYYDEPFGDQSAIPTSLVSKVARQSVTVALSADGGDEVFAGYNRYDYLLKYGKLLNKVPGVARKLMVGLMNNIPADKIPLLKKNYLFSSRYEKFKNILTAPDWKKIMESLASQFDDNGVANLLKVGTGKKATLYQTDQLKDEFYTPLSYLMAIDYQTYLPDDILTKVDRATMRFSLEGREPFLDHQVIEWAARLPDEYKYNDGVKKRILREIVYRYLPRELMDRPKAGFAVPFDKWLLNELRPKVEHYLSDRVIKDQGIFQSAEVQRLKALFLNGKKELGQKIWHLLMFQMWYEKWM